MPRPLAFVCYVHRRTSPPLLVPPSVGRSVMATASEVDTPRYKDAEFRIELDMQGRACGGTHGSRDLAVGNSNIVAIDVCISIRTF